MRDLGSEWWVTAENIAASLSLSLYIYIHTRYSQCYFSLGFVNLEEEQARAATKVRYCTDLGVEEQSKPCGGLHFAECQ